MIAFLATEGGMPARQDHVRRAHELRQLAARRTGWERDRLLEMAENWERLGRLVERCPTLEDLGKGPLDIEGRE